MPLTISTITHSTNRITFAFNQLVWGPPVISWKLNGHSNGGNGKLKSLDLQRIIKEKTLSIAKDRGYDQAQPWHLLLALAGITEIDSEAGELLKEIILSKYRVDDPFAQLERHFPLDTKRVYFNVDPIPLKILDAIFDQAEKIAEKNESTYVSTSHILAALFVVCDSDLAINDFKKEHKKAVEHFLRSLGVSPTQKPEPRGIFKLATISPTSSFLHRYGLRAYNYAKKMWHGMWEMHTVEYAEGKYVKYRYLTHENRAIEDSMVAYAALSGSDEIFLEHLLLALAHNRGQEKSSESILMSLLAKSSKSRFEMVTIILELDDPDLKIELPLDLLMSIETHDIEGQNVKEAPTQVYPSNEVREVFDKARAMNGGKAFTYHLLLALFEVVYDPKRLNTFGDMQNKLQSLGINQKDIEALKDKIFPT